MSANSHTPQILFYLGYDNDRGGICSFLRALSTASAPHFEITLGMNAGAQHTQSQPALPVIEFPRIAGETISPRTLLRSRTIAHAAREWLHADSRRIFHGCSRAGLLVALWLARWGERRVCATVHCYGRQRWFYRHAARVLGNRLKLTSPDMARYYGLPPQTWDECLPPCALYGVRDFSPAFDGPIYWPASRSGSGINSAVKSGTEVPRSIKDRNSAKIIRAAGIGALARRKGWHLVLDALAQLPPETRARWRFTHIGCADDTPESRRYAAELHERADALGLSSCVRWLGQQPSSDALLRESDVLLVPSNHEPFSLARIESLAVGVPSISSDTGAALDIIAPPMNGWLFRNNDATDLARVIEQLSTPNALAAARIDRDLLRRFTPEACAAQHARLYEKLFD